MIERTSCFVLVTLAILCYSSVAKSSEDLESLKEEAKLHGLNPSEAMKALDKHFKPAKYDRFDVLNYMSQYSVVKKNGIPAEYENEWETFAKSSPLECKPDISENIKRILKLADAEWFHTNNRWRQVPPPLLIQSIVLRFSERHAQYCTKEYIKQVHSKIVRTKLDTVAIVDAINMEASHSCMKKSTTWAQLRRDLPDSKEYYDCVRSNPEIFKEAIISNSKQEKFDKDVANHLVETAVDSCKTMVENLRDVFDMVAYSAELYPGQSYGSSDLNEIWVASETCKEFIGRENGDVIELIANYRPDPTKSSKRSKVLNLLGRNKDQNAAGALRIHHKGDPIAFDHYVPERSGLSNQDNYLFNDYIRQEPRLALEGKALIKVEKQGADSWSHYAGNNIKGPEIEKQGADSWSHYTGNIIKGPEIDKQGGDSWSYYPGNIIKGPEIEKQGGDFLSHCTGNDIKGCGDSIYQTI